MGNSIVTNQDQLAEHMVEHYKCLFNNVSILQDNGLVQDVIPHLVTTQANNLLTMLPSKEEIYNATFILRKDSLAGPDEFRLLFYQTYWKVIKDYVIKATL